jgi:MtN3 and saliva related transmembrane protein
MVNPKTILLPKEEQVHIKPKNKTMTFTQIVGFVATILSIATYMPQVFQLYRTKSARDISMPMLLLLCFGVAIWLSFGIWIKDTPLILTNGLILSMSLLMVIMKIKYDKKLKS